MKRTALLLVGLTFSALATGCCSPGGTVYRPFGGTTTAAVAYPTYTPTAYAPTTYATTQTFQAIPTAMATSCNCQ